MSIFGDRFAFCTCVYIWILVRWPECKGYLTFKKVRIPGWIFGKSEIRRLAG